MPVNYETDPLKHYVRKYGWLTAARQQKHTIRNRSKRIPLRYFTFCAAGAIDVFMLERAGILKRSGETGRLEGVYFCEENDEDFGRIADLIGTPENGFRGTFEDIVLFKDDEDTDGKELKDELEIGNVYSDEVREKLGRKDTHYRLRKAFPFDIINLDVCGVMFPPKRDIIAPLLESIIQILAWQTESKFSINERECKRFTLFLTSHIDPNDTNQHAIEQLENRVIENIHTNKGFQDAFVRQYGHNQAPKLIHENFAEFFSIAFPKFMIHEALFRFGWKVTCGPTYLYNRDYRREENRQYQIMHAVSVYERIPSFGKSLDIPNVNQYTQSVIQLVNDKIKWVDEIIGDSDITRELEEDLNQIITLRDHYHNLQ